MPTRCSFLRDDFARDIKEHKITIIQDNKEHKHIRLKKPGTRVMSFDLITWPGHLCYTGDMGTYVFKRLVDMFAFFRDTSPNPSYWAEKILASDRSDGITKFSPDVFSENIATRFNDATEDWEAERKSHLWDKIEEYVLSKAEDGQDAAMRAACDFQCEGFAFHDFYACDCTTYSFRYEWACYAIPWAIAQYDAVCNESQQPTATEEFMG